MKNIFKSTLALAFASVISATPALANTESGEIQQEMTQSVSKVNINTASVDALVNLPGIGKKKAKAIVDYREENGKFLIIEDLQNVKGIGKKAMSRLAPLVTV